MGNIKPWDNKDTLREVSAFIDELAAKENHSWSWVKNWDCKYIDIRVDMRDGHFTMRNKEGVRITLDELKYQRELKD